MNTSYGQVRARQEKRDLLHALVTRNRETSRAARSPESVNAEPAPTPEREPEYEWEFDFAFDDWYDPRLTWCRRYATT